MDGEVFYEPLQGGERYEDGGAGSGEAPLDIYLVQSQRERGHKPLLLAEIKAGQGTVIFLSHACRLEHIVFKFLSGIRKVHHQECEQEHPFISALQITEEIFCLTSISGKVGGE